MAFFPNQRPSSVDLNNAKRMREGALNDQRARAAKWNAQQLKKELDSLKKRLKGLIESIEHDWKHRSESPNEDSEGYDGLEEIAKTIEKVGHTTHESVEHSP